MISILCIGVATALAVFALWAKARAGRPAKAQKWEKADIVKQLLALSEREDGISAIAPSRSRTPLTSPALPPAELPRKMTGGISQPSRSNKAPC